jgi:hypothetical protein
VTSREPPVADVKQHTQQFAGHIYPPAFLALGSCVFTTHIIVPYDNETIGIILILAELAITKLQGHQLAPAKTGAKCSEKERIVGRTDLFRCFEEVDVLVLIVFIIMLCSRILNIEIHC